MVADIAHPTPREVPPQAPLLRFIACGSVDDGKSTLIGRLVYECGGVLEDQFRSLQRESADFAGEDGSIDFALLLDGLQAEREQGITIDVAYRYFSSAKRRFVVADAPGHEQYTRNMATAASTSQLALILVDARKGLLTQTLRHSRIVRMMGLCDALLAVNKMDLVGFDEGVFREIQARWVETAIELGFRTAHAIPLAARAGDNVTRPSERMHWYGDGTLLEWLESFAAPSLADAEAFHMPVQWVCRPHADFRGFCGRVAAGEIRPGCAVRVLPSNAAATVRELVSWEGPRSAAVAGESTLLTLDSEVDVSRGDVIVAADAATVAADQFEAKLLWLSETHLLVGRSYLLKIHAKEVSASVTAIRYEEDVRTGARLAARTLGLNAIATVNVSLSEPVVFLPYDRNRHLGSFILIDKLDRRTVGAGMIKFALRRSANVSWQPLDIDKRARAHLKQQQPRCVWFTGLSGAGKSTIANLLERRLHALGRHTYILDGDNVRHGLSRDLGFTEVDRVENVRRAAEVAKLMVDAGLIVLVSFISPYRAERDFARSLFAEGEFIEVFVDAPLEVCERRDPKQLYAKARSGLVSHLTGIDSAYEPPVAPDVHLLTAHRTPRECVDELLAKLS